MMDKLATQGVRFAEVPATRPAPQASAPAHAPWQHLPWQALGTAARVLPAQQMPAGLLLHRCLRARWQGPAVVHDPGEAARPYRPANLAAYVDPGSGAMLPGVLEVQ
jgi:hypothetical protein